jgi:hypothetical protein
MRALDGAAEMQLPGERVLSSSRTNGKPGGHTDSGLQLNQRTPNAITKRPGRNMAVCTARR